MVALRDESRLAAGRECTEIHGGGKSDPRLLFDALTSTDPGQHEASGVFKGTLDRAHADAEFAADRKIREQSVKLQRSRFDMLGCGRSSKDRAS